MHAISSKLTPPGHEQTSEFMTRTFIPLSVEESSAILHHHGSLGWDSAKDDLPSIYQKYNLALLLHTADMLATFMDEYEGHH